MPNQTTATPESSASRFPREAVPFRCPQCGASTTVKAQSIVEAADTAARRRLLDGSLNLARCPMCGLASRLAAPLLYHDSSHDIAFVLVPQALQMAHTEQEAAVGRLTNRVLDSLPPAERRMYLLQPTLFISDAAFIEAVRGAPAPNDAGHAVPAAAAGIARDGVPVGSEGPGGAAVEAGQPFEVDFGEVVEALFQAQAEGALDEAVAELRMLLDYPFFAELTAQADALREEGRRSDGDELLALRGAVVEAIDRVDATTKAALDEAVASLRDLLSSADPAQALRDLPLEALNDAFFLVLSANQQAASDAGDTATAERLGALGRAAADALEEKLPPLRRLVARLARSGDAGAQAALLDADPELWGEELQAALYGTAAAARSGGAPDMADNLSHAAGLVADRLRVSRVGS